MKIFNKRIWGAKFLLLLVLFQSCTDHVPPGDGDPGPGSEIPKPSEGSIYVLSEGNLVYEVDVRNTTQGIDVITVETQFPDEKILTIDFRPATGQLYALSNFATLYIVNVNKNRTGKSSTPVNPYNQRPDPVPAISKYGFDFDPVADMIRVSNNLYQASATLNPETMDDDGNIGGLNEQTLAWAYSNNYSGATTTTLFGIDPQADQLIRFRDRVARQKEVVGSLGTNIDEVGGFDIAARTSYQQEYAMAAVRRGEKWELDVVDLSSGEMEKFGDLPSGSKILGLAIPTPVAYAIDQDRKLLSFNPADNYQDGFGDLIVEKLIKGVPSGVKLLGLDLSVSVGPRLYALADNSKIYQINTRTGDAIENCTLKTPINFANNPAVGIDFDPYDNKLRVVTSTRKNFKVELGTGLVTELDVITQEGDLIGLDAGAYDNVQLGLTNPGFTHFYGINSETKALYTMDPSTFALTKVTNLKIEGTISKTNGFDIGGAKGEYGYAIFTAGGKTGLYILTLNSGEVFEYHKFPFQVNGFTLGRFVTRPRL